MILKCIECKCEFESNRKALLCPSCKVKPLVCVICGKEFPKKYFPYDQKTCSSKCRGLYRAQSGIAKEGAAKMKDTKLSRYGSLDPAVVSKLKNGGKLTTKICPLCGKEFEPDTPRQIYCKDKHYGPCPVCGKEVEIKEYYAGPQACSEKCRMERIYATNLKKYGCKDSVNSEHAKALAKKHSMERYGTEYYSQSAEGKAKFKKTIMDKYGVSAPILVPEFREKSRQTCLDKYGTEWASQFSEIRDRIVKTNIERHGGMGLGSPKLREKIVSTTRSIYGVDFAISNSEVRAKAARSLKEKYGAENYWSSKEHIASVIIDPSKADEFMSFKENPKKYIESHYDYKPPIYVLTHDLGVSDTPIYDALVKNDCRDIINHTKTSSMEIEVRDFLQSLAIDNVIVNDRKVIKPMELDFYLPDYAFAIECNPTLSHNSTIGGWYDDPKPHNYHKLKTDKAEEKGTFLFHIFGWEWEHRRDIIKSMIRNSLGLTESKIHARNTHIVDVSFEESKVFLQSNHRQGSCQSRIRLGLVEDSTGRLVSIMTFGSTRPGIGKQESDDDSCFELLRFCNLLNTTVVGGASKLFNHFIKTYKPLKVISFSDRAHTKGNLYSKLGFQEISRSDPSYVWVKPYGEIVKTRVSCQKHNLTKCFDDVDENIIKTKSENEIMIEHGFVQVYDSGVKRWEYTPAGAETAATM